eukprot:Seg353.9 transcript_id=Seg353.9/GoldUCD/mRNA.D3Y31 product="hypothetical protein" protein_id=Seg353.9/GoldUCD/D3Y31
MSKHLRLRHPEVARNIDSVTAKPDDNDAQSSHSDNTSASTSTNAETRSSDISNPASDILSSVLFSPPKGVVLKKSKVSPPLLAEPGNVLFSSPGVSPLFHKAAASTESSSLPDNMQAEHNENIHEPTIVEKSAEKTPEHKCVVQGCASTFKLKSLVRRKWRGGGHNVWDWESTMLVITYFRLDKIRDPFEAHICNQHWRNWYRYNYKIKQALCFYLDDAKEQNQFLNLIDAAGHTPSHTELSHNVTPGIFFEEASHLLIHVLHNLNCDELKTLSLTCKFMNQQVKIYLQDDTIWERLLIDKFFVSRKLTGKKFHESFKAIELYCHERKQFLSDPNLNQSTITSELARELNVSLQKDNNLEKMLRAFGQNRPAMPIEMLVYFTARCLAPYFLTYNQYMRQDCESEPVVSDFRVGTEISSMPFIFLLFDLVLTGNGMTQPSSYSACSTLLKCLSIHTIRQKMRDCKAITPLQKVLSNEVSLTRSKNLMSALNITGLSFSCSKDLKDSKVARHMWNTVGVKSSLQNTPSNMHWIETENLETMLKSTSIHNAERLTHFLTSQLEYVNGQQVFLDLFERPQAQHINSSAFHLTTKEKNEHLEFLKICFNKVVELHEFLSCDEIVCGLAQSSNNDNTNIVN